MSMYKEHSSLNRAAYRGRSATCPRSGGSGLFPLHLKTALNVQYSMRVMCLAHASCFACHVMCIA